MIYTMTGNNTPVELNPQLSYFLQNFLHWKDLNELQKETFPLISEGNDSLIIAPTASGKTESALIPIYNNILNEHLPRTSTLYIAPLKALINDMYLRIKYWNKHFGLTATKWHGDVKAKNKRNYLANPTDFLLITPESLEVILINRNETEKEKIFENIKYVIIDEIHYFAGSERGIQLNSLLARISKYNSNFTKIGLSATLGNPDDVAKWINTEQPASIIQYTNDRNIKYKIVKYDEYEDIPKTLSKYKDKKILIFAKSRGGVEFYYNLIKKEFDTTNIFLHHASISKELRQKNEEEFRNATNGVMIATSTLELGIDIGNIDIIGQISTTNTISSLMQRIGRGGRRNNIQRVIFFINSESEAILTLAQISLINQNIVEDVNIRRRAKDIYLHQILSIIFEETEISFKEIYYRLNSCYSFSKISKDDFREILQYLIDTDMIQLDHGLLSLGYGFEKEFGKINFMNFYSVFPTSAQYTIKKGREVIGELDYLYIMGLNEDDTFILGGNYWKVINIDSDNFVIHVTEGNKTDKVPSWSSSMLMLNYLISQEIYNILLGNFDVSLLNYFDEEYYDDILRWNTSLNKHNLNVDSLPVVISEHDDLNRVELCTFAGNYVNFLLIYLLSKKFNIKRQMIFALTLIFYTDENVNDILDYIDELKYNFDTEFDVIMDDLSKEEITSKFIDYLPEEQQGDVVKEVLFNINDFKELISKCKLKIVQNLLISALDL